MDNACTPDLVECPGSTCGVSSLVCQGGERMGAACIPDTAECPASRCGKIPYAEGSPVFHAELTIIVDDHVSKWDGTAAAESVKAATILLKTRYQDKEYLLAQTYQNHEGSSDITTFLAALQTGPILSDTDKSRGAVDESKLNDALDEGFINTPPADSTRSLLDDLKWQMPDGPVSEELRRIFGMEGVPVMGDPIIVRTPRSLSHVSHSDYESSGLASVIRLLVTFRFVK